MLDLQHLQLSAQLGLVVWMLLCVFTKEHYILAPYQSFLNWLEPKAKPIAYVLGACEKCFCGQLALWTWFSFNEYNLSSCFTTLYFQFLEHLSFVCLSILFVIIFKKAFQSWI